MSVLTKNFPPAKQLIANYIGGIGYYALHFSWMLLLLFVILGAMQYIVSPGEPLRSTPAMTATPDAAIGIQLPRLISVPLLAVTIISVVLFIIALPYIIGRASRRLPLWILAQTSWKPGAQSVYRTKQSLVGCLAIIAIIFLYYPGGAPAQNMSFFIVVASCLFAALSFWLQYMLTVLWKIPQRSVF